MRRLLLKNWILESEKTQPLSVSVPCDVTDELYKVGLIEDPLFGQNADKAAWIAEEDWTFTCVFDVEKDLLSESRVQLCFEGIDTLSEISLNGVKIGETENMFLRYDFNVKPLLRAKENLLEVKILSATKRIRERNDGTNYRALFTQDRIYIRKAQCHWGWDWAPKLPGIGLWLPVYLQADSGVTIENVKVDAFSSGDVRFILSMHNNGSHLFENKDGAYSLRVSVGAQSVEHVVTARIQLLNLKIDEPKLWWPNGYGEQNLYEYTAELIKDGETVSVKRGTFGFRTIELCQAPLGENRSEFALVVNGRKIFAKGSNWVPVSTMTGAIPDSAYEKLLSIAKDGNMNMLRVWGGGVYEKEIFYELCDRLGIMVWQDFMFSCSAIPAAIEGMEEGMRAEAEYQIKRLRNHPSIALWCGGNEYMPHAQGNYYTAGNYFVRVILRGICAELDPYRVYVHNSPVGLDDDEWRYTNGDAHVSCMDDLLEGDAVYRYRKLIAEREAQFVSESAHLGPTRLRSIKRFIPEDELWPTGDSWEYHFVKNPYAIIPMTCLMKEKFFAEKFFGEPTGLTDFLKKAMLAHAELLRSELDFARSNPNCKGFMNWMYNDIWGCGTWSLVDYYYERKPVYYVMKRGFAPITLRFAEHKEGVKLSLSNDTEKVLKGTLIYAEKRLDGTVLREHKKEVSVGVDEVLQFSAPEGDADYLTAELLYGDAKTVKTIYFPKLWKGLPFVKDIDSQVTKKEGGRYEITIRANAFARSVFIDYPDNDGVTYSDNFFDMERGDTVTVSVYSEKPLDVSLFTVKTFSEEWED